MSQHDYTIANQGFPATRADINNALSAIATNNSGTTAPSTQYAGQFWIDTTTTTWTLYIHDGSDDIQFATIDTSANTVNFIDSELGDNSVTTAKIADANVTSAKLSYPLTTFSSTGIDDNATSTAITIDSSENVGIGTASPSVKLEVTDDIAIRGGSDRRITLGSNGTIDANDSNHLRADGTNLKFNTAGGVYIFEQNGTEAMRITSAGDFLVGKTFTSVTTVGDELRADGEAVFVRASGHCLRLQRLTSEGNVAVFYNNVGTNTGSISVGGSATSYNTSSDYRLKENVNYDFDAISRLKELKPVRFNFINEPNKTVDGFIAHEVSSVVPEAITGTKDAMKTEEYEVTPAVLDEDGNLVTEPVMGTREVPEYQGIDQAKLVPILTKALQEAVNKIETLEARITALENA